MDRITKEQCSKNMRIVKNKDSKIELWKNGKNDIKSNKDFCIKKIESNIKRDEENKKGCYHIYNRDDFQQYLFNNTKLETPSTSRYNFGTVYTENNKNYIKLNLQIRFL